MYGEHVPRPLAGRLRDRPGKFALRFGISSCITRAWSRFTISGTGIREAPGCRLPYSRFRRACPCRGRKAAYFFEMTELLDVVVYVEQLGHYFKQLKTSYLEV